MKLTHRRQVREDGKDKNSVVSFTLTDEPQHIDLVTSNSKEEVREMFECEQTLPLFVMKSLLHPRITSMRCVLTCVCVFFWTGGETGSGVQGRAAASV